jgi:hypothetical protein
MTQRNLAFITGHVRGSETLAGTVLDQVERFVELGRRNIVVMVDTFPDLEDATIDALHRLAHRAAELKANVKFAALNERTVTALRRRPTTASLHIIERVDQIPGAA